MFLEGRKQRFGERMLQIDLQNIKSPSAALQELYFRMKYVYFLQTKLQKKRNTNKANWQQQRQFGANF